MEVKLKRNRKTGEKKDLRNRTQCPQETPTHQTANKTKRALERATSTDKIMREKERNREKEREEECKARSVDSWRKAEFADGSGSFFFAWVGNSYSRVEGPMVPAIIFEPLQPRVELWQWTETKGFTTDRSFGRPKKKTKFLRQRSLGLHTTSWDDNEWALRGEERSGWASFGPVANV